MCKLRLVDREQRERGLVLVRAAAGRRAAGRLHRTKVGQVRPDQDGATERADAVSHRVRDQVVPDIERGAAPEGRQSYHTELERTRLAVVTAAGEQRIDGRGRGEQQDGEVERLTPG